MNKMQVENHEWYVIMFLFLVFFIINNNFVERISSNISFSLYKQFAAYITLSIINLSSLTRSRDRGYTQIVKRGIGNAISRILDVENVL